MTTTEAESRYALAIEDAPEGADVEAVRAGLIAFNLRHTTDDDYRRLAVFLRDAEGTVVGGLVGETFWGWLHVDLLWVAEEARGQGHGSRLLAAAEAEAVGRGCGHAYVETLAFQAPDFYRARGYRVFGELADFPAGHRRYYLAKRLGAWRRAATASESEWNGEAEAIPPRPRGSGTVAGHAGGRTLRRADPDPRRFLGDLGQVARRARIGERQTALASDLQPRLASDQHLPQGLLRRVAPGRARPQVGDVGDVGVVLVAPEDDDRVVVVHRSAFKGSSNRSTSFRNWRT